MSVFDHNMSCTSWAITTGARNSLYDMNRVIGSALLRFDETGGGGGNNASHKTA